MSSMDMFIYMEKHYIYKLTSPSGNGSIDGPIKYEERRLFLKNRNLKKDSNGRFIN